jgi:hypothetical protein
MVVKPLVHPVFRTIITIWGFDGGRFLPAPDLSLSLIVYPIFGIIITIWGFDGGGFLPLFGIIITN